MRILIIAVTFAITGAHRGYTQENSQQYQFGFELTRINQWESPTLSPFDSSDFAITFTLPKFFFTPPGPDHDYLNTIRSEYIPGDGSLRYNQELIYVLSYGYMCYGQLQVAHDHLLISNAACVKNKKQVGMFSCQSSCGAVLS